MNRERPASVRRPWGPIVLLLVFGAAAWGSVLWGAAAAEERLDPFYERLFQDGTLALSTGDSAGAVRQLSLACFGMLDVPQQLGDCLTRLALAQAVAEDREGFLLTLARVLEIERRFGAWSAASIPPEMRRDFERQVEQWAPPESLTGIDAFRDIADRQRGRELAKLPAEERRRELDRLIARSPSNGLWRRLQVELELESGNFELAADLVENLVPGRDDIRCLRGRAESGRGSCDSRTLVDLDSCAGAEQAKALEALLACHVESGDRRSGEAVAARLTPEQRDKSKVRDLLRRLERLEETPVAQVEPSAPARADSGPSQEEILDLDRGWDTLRADARGRFESTFTAVARLADSYPQWAEAQHLAAELAYRVSRWPEAVRYFERAEAVSPLRPDQQFYLAVALFKSGDQSAAEVRLERCLPLIQSSEYVRFWTERIRSGG